jgi:two-component system sensor histidine kinase HydH
MSRIHGGSWFAEHVPPVAQHAPSAEMRKRELRDVEDGASERVIDTIIRFRARFFPLPLVVAGALIWLAPTVWRYALIALAIVSFAALGYLERLSRRTGEHRDFLLPAWVAGIAQIAVVVVMGGLAGPIAPALPLIALVMNLIAPGRQAIYFVVLMQIPAVWLLAVAQAYDLIPDLVPEAWHGLFAPPGTPGLGAWITAGFYTVILLGGMTMGRVIRAILMGMLFEQLVDRDRQLEAYEESARALSQMTAEIAHELKNPLASIKGLAALVRKDLSGQTAERMDVLRREVDRLQGILEEFLSYSRPLIPIDEERVDLAELVREVIELHEGIARQADVRLRATADQVHLRCDPRKIKRVLINLVQNAIEASPKGGEVVIEIARDHEGARIEVRDEGSGISSEAAAKLFQVGFTTKDEGTGIGLALARGLARQHGGELTLERRDGARGCVATLTLPSAPVSAVGASAVIGSASPSPSPSTSTSTPTSSATASKAGEVAS